MFERILIAYDGSEHSKRAARMAGDIARMNKKAEVWLVCVMERVPTSLGRPYLQEFIDEQTQTGDRYIQEARELIGDATIHEELLYGSPAEEILEVAGNNDCDLIVTGTRGMSMLEGLLMGSQVHKIISHAQCPVLAVK